MSSESLEIQGVLQPTKYQTKHQAQVLIKITMDYEI